MEVDSLNIIERMSFNRYVSDRLRGISKETMVLFEKRAEDFEKMYQDKRIVKSNKKNTNGKEYFKT